MIVSSAKAHEAAEVLGVTLDDLNDNTLKSAYRAKTKECHPDHHGMTKIQMWARVSWAKECLTHWLHSNPPREQGEVPVGDCRACGGTGRVKISSSGFGAPLTMWCVMCEGTGGRQERDGD